MTKHVFDRIKETSTTTGTGTLTLAGTSTGYKTFASRYSTNDRVPYVIVHQTADEWETGYGTYAGSSTLARTTVYQSSNSDSAVNFSAGTKDVFVDQVADFTGWITLIKTSDESRNTTTTITADSTLKFPMVASTRYVFRCKVFFDTAATPDFKWRHVGPASPTLVRIRRFSIAPLTTSLAAISIDTAFSASDLAITTTSGTTGGFIDFEGIIVNGANAGDFSFSWAQNTSDAANTTVLAGSYIEYRSV